MNDKYAKEIAKELKLIRRELEKQNKGITVDIDGKELAKTVNENNE